MGTEKENQVILQLAPMEGITTYIYRNAFNKYYGGIDTYYCPFISTHKNKELNFKEKKEILPENNKGIKMIPQLLTADAEEFIYTSSQIAELGYDTVNLNFGCPSGTVTAKGKGSGILADTKKLYDLLDAIFSKTDLKISVKTRIGVSDKSEWEEIQKVYESFPFEELIIHSRVRDDFYKKPADKSILSFVPKELFDKTKIVYNGDIYTSDDYYSMCERYDGLYGIMLGRGIIANPLLAAEIKQGEEFDIEKFIAFNLEIMDSYNAVMKSEKNTLFKVKELWFYMSGIFDDKEKVLKKSRKCNNLREYEIFIKSLEKNR